MFKMGQSVQVHQACIGDPGLVEVELLKIGESLQMDKTCVGDIPWEDQGFKIGQSFQVPQTCVGDSGLYEVENLKIGESLQLLQACIGDLGKREAQLSEPGQVFEVNQASSGDSSKDGEGLKIFQPLEVF